jgi:hypothetical protein
VAGIVPFNQGFIMSKTSGTTKTATFLRVWADCGEEAVSCGGDFNAAHRAGDGNMFVETSRGLAAWTNTFTNVQPGERVILRRTSGGTMPWVMTGAA